MKVFKITLLILLSAIIVFSMVLCGDDKDPVETATPTPATPTPPTPYNIQYPDTADVWTASTTCLNGEGSLCKIAATLLEFYGCKIMGDDAIIKIDAADIAALIDDLNGFWAELVVQMKADTFDTAAVTDEFGKILDAQYIKDLIPELADYLATNTDITWPVLDKSTCESITGINKYIAEFAATSQPDCTGEDKDDYIWCSINSYVEIIGLTADQAWTILSGAVGDLNTEFQLTTILGKLSCGETVTYTPIDAENLEDLEEIIMLLLGTSAPDKDTIVATVNQLLADDGLVDSLIAAVVDILKEIHDADENGTVAGLIDTLPGLAAGIFDRENAPCIEEEAAE